MTIQGAVQSFNPGNKVELYILDLTPIGGTALRYCSDSDNNSPLSFGGAEYQPLPITAEGFSATSSGSIPQPTLTIADKNGVIGALMRNSSGTLLNKDMLGAIFTKITTLSQYLDGHPEANASAHFPIEQYQIERKTSQNRHVTTFALGSVMDLEGTMLPKRIMLKDICNFVYRIPNGSGGYTSYTEEDACPYQGANYFNEQNLPTTMALDKCNKRFSGCLVRYPHPEPVPFSNFPGISHVRS